MERLAIVGRDDAYNRLYPPLTFASVAAKKGIEVNMLFVLWAASADRARCQSAQNRSSARDRRGVVQGTITARRRPVGNL